FRGSSNIQNWMDNLDFIKVGYPGVQGGEVHKGFYNAWLDLLPEVMPPAQKLIDMNNGGNILITGHSLGAALAQLCALNVSYYMYTNGINGFLFVEDFGSPRWSNDV